MFTFSYRATKENNHVSKGWPNHAFYVSKVGLVSLHRIQQAELDESRPNDDILIYYVQSECPHTAQKWSTEETAKLPTWLALLKPNNQKKQGGIFYCICSVMPNKKQEITKNLDVQIRRKRKLSYSDEV